MTLGQWAKKFRKHVETAWTGAKSTQFSPGTKAHQELFHLSDYRVSSVVAGTVWLTNKQRAGYRMPGRRKNPRQPRSHRGSWVVLRRVAGGRQRVARFATYDAAKQHVVGAKNNATLYILPDRLSRKYLSNPRKKYRRRRR